MIYNIISLIFNSLFAAAAIFLVCATANTESEAE